MHDDAIVFLRQFFTGGGAVYPLANVKKDDLRTIQSYAKQLFLGGNAVAAIRLYTWLLSFDHWNNEYWLSIGVCYQHLEHDEEALPYLVQAGMICPSDPRAAYYTGLSLERLRYYNAARRAYADAISWASNEHTSLSTVEQIAKHATQAIARLTMQDEGGQQPRRNGENL